MYVLPRILSTRLNSLSGDMGGYSQQQSGTAHTEHCLCDNIWPVLPNCLPFSCLHFPVQACCRLISLPTGDLKRHQKLVEPV